MGVVTDPKGAVLRGITVELTNPNTGLDRTATTNDAGSYEFLAVPVGSGYQVTAKGSGFETQTESDIKLLVNQKFTVNFSLRVGRVTQQVDVKADAVQVESTSTQVGTVIEAAKMTAVPLNGRSFVDLLGLQAGVVPVTSSAADSEVGGALSVNGQREKCQFLSGKRHQRGTQLR